MEHGPLWGKLGELLYEVIAEDKYFPKSIDGRAWADIPVNMQNHFYTLGVRLNQRLAENGIRLPEGCVNLPHMRRF